MPSVKEKKLKTSISQGKASEQEQSLAQLQERLGSSGTQSFGGRYDEEYSSEWKDEQRIDNVEQMRRGDGAIRAILRAMKSPLMGAEWTVETTDTTPKGEEIKEFVEKSLFGMRRTWKEFLRESLGYLDFGFYWFEIIWEKRDGKIVIADLEPRIPRSIFRWKLSDGSFGVVQLLRSDDTEKRTAEIPASKLLILTNDKEGDDVTGQSILRAAHKHWYYKNNLYAIAGIAAERYGVGVPTVKLGEAAGDKEKTDAEDMAESVHSNERSFAVLQHDMEFQIVTPTGNPQGAAIENQVNHHNTQIALSVLATFLMLGADGTGSLALSQDQSSFFLNVLRDIAAYQTEQIQKQVIQRMVDLNYGKQGIYPQLKHSPLGDIDYGEFSTTLSTLTQAGLLDVDPRMLQYIHSTFNLPKITDERIEMLEEQRLETELAKLEAPDMEDGMEVPKDDDSEPVEPDEEDDEE